MSELPNHWREYARRQDQLAQKCRVDGHAWGLEAALDSFLRDTDRSGDAVDRTSRSASRKERHRGRLRRIYLRPDQASHASHPDDAIHAKRRLEGVRARATRAQWALLVAIGQGYEYRELASGIGVAPGTLRARMHRLRRDISVPESGLYDRHGGLQRLAS